MTGSMLLRVSTALILAIAITSHASSLAEASEGPAAGSGHGRMGGSGSEDRARFAVPVAPAGRSWNRDWHHRGWWPGAAFETGTGTDLSYDDPDGPDADDESDSPDSFDNSDEAVSPAPFNGDAASYCAQRFRSYDPASGTYLGNDGQRHPCP